MRKSNAKTWFKFGCIASALFVLVSFFAFYWTKMPFRYNNMIYTYKFTLWDLVRYLGNMDAFKAHIGNDKVAEEMMKVFRDFTLIFYTMMLIPILYAIYAVLAVTKFEKSHFFGNIAATTTMVLTVFMAVVDVDIWERASMDPNAKYVLPGFLTLIICKGVFIVLLGATVHKTLIHRFRDDKRVWTCSSCGQENSIETHMCGSCGSLRYNSGKSKYERYLLRFWYDHDFRTMIFTIISGITLVLSLLKVKFSLFGFEFDIAWIAIILSGTPMLWMAIYGLFTRLDIKAGVLVSLALIAAVYINAYFAAGEVAFIMMVGELLENSTMRKAREGLSGLISLAPKTARVLVDGTEKVISASQVNIGDHILVKPGETIPVDGKILSGETSVNQAVMTGESMPVAKTAGDEVFVGTINQHGAIEIETTKIGADSSLGKMISLVKEAEEKKARVVRIADKWAGYIVPVALFIAILVYFGGASLSQGMVILASHHKTGSQYYNQIQRAVTVLVVFCPCALVLATPTAMMAAIGNATKKGILIKSGEALELMSRITAIAFDKTGTITEGKPAVVSTLCFNGSRENELISLAASAERLSEHHLGQAVIRFAEQKGIETLPADNFLMHSGKGISVNIKGYPVFVGNIRLMEENGIAISEDEKEQVQEQQKNGKTVLLVSDQKHLLGFISVADTVKKNARDSVLKLKNAGIKNVVLITGDNEVTANAIATQTDIVNVYSSQLPEDKVNVVKKLMENSSVAMVGDGVNDAPALATANVGIAMGAMGTDIAIEAADIALMSDELERLPELIDLSKKTMSTIKINIIISMCINALAITAAAAGILNPAMGAIVHNAGSVLVVANSAMMLKYKLNQ